MFGAVAALCIWVLLPRVASERDTGEKKGSIATNDARILIEDHTDASEPNDTTALHLLSPRTVVAASVRCFAMICFGSVSPCGATAFATRVALYVAPNALRPRDGPQYRMIARRARSSAG